MRPLASAPLAAPLPRQSGAETFWNSRGCDLNDRSALVSSSFPSPDAGWVPAAPADVRSRPHATRLSTSTVQNPALRAQLPPSIFQAESRILEDRKSTRLNSSHGYISYAVFCLKKKKKAINIKQTRDVK